MKNSMPRFAFWLRFVSSKNLMLTFWFTGIFIAHADRARSQANTTLSNLVSPVSVNQSILPNFSNSKNLGSTGKSWKDIYMGGTFYQNGARLISTTGDNLFMGLSSGNSTVAGYDNTSVGKTSGFNLTTGYENTFLGSTAGYSNTTGYRNTFIGRASGYYNTQGNNNTFIGEAAGYKNLGDAFDYAGNRNTFIGARAGYNNTEGRENTFVGVEAGHINTSGINNTSMGYQALYSNTEGNQNSAFGNLSLFNNTIGAFNSAFGYQTLPNNTTGSSNSAFGTYALHNNTTGSGNSAFGIDALYNNVTGDYNSAFGKGALVSNSSGSYISAFGYYALSNNSTGTENSAFGYYALTANSSGSGNVALGHEVLFNNTTGSKNVAVGTQAGIANTTGNYGTFVGYDAGGSNTTGSQNTYIGYSAEGSSSTYTNVVGIGYQLTNTASNQARIGNSSTTSIGGWAGWSNVSDGRFKKNVKEEVAGLAFINKLRPVTYTLDLHAADAFIGKEFTADHETEESAKISEQAKSEKEKIIYSGLIAQEVEEAAKEIGYDFSGVDAPKNENDFYGLRYAEFVVPLVKAVQELDLENSTLKMENGELQTEVNDLRSRLERIESQLGIIGELKQTSGNVSGAALEQNITNPAKNTTTIGFYVPANANNSQLIITDASGKIIQQFSHLMVGQSQVEIATPGLASGTYQYSLYVDGKKVDTKQMIITK